MIFFWCVTQRFIVSAASAILAILSFLSSYSPSCTISIISSAQCRVAESGLRTSWLIISIKRSCCYFRLFVSSVISPCKSSAVFSSVILLITQIRPPSPFSPNCFKSSSFSGISDRPRYSSVSPQSPVFSRVAIFVYTTAPYAWAICS